MKAFLKAVLKYMRSCDLFLLFLCILSSAYGIVLIYSATRYNGDNSSVIVQIASTVIGIGLFILFSLIDIDGIADKSKLLFVASLLFIATLFVWGRGEGGNTAWLRFGGIGIQPAEVTKIPFAIIIARMLAKFRSRQQMSSPFSMLQVIFVFAAFFGLIIIASSDLGSALVYLFMLVVVLFLGGVRLHWFALGAALTGIAAPFAWRYLLTSRQKARILAPFDPSVDTTGLDVMWQANRSKQAISGGGFTGQGLLSGRMTQTGAVPQQRTDFIFSAAGEELGFIGCAVIILLLTLIIIRCFYVGIRSNDTLGFLVCAGFAAMFIMQTLENIGMCLGLTPVIGITLPFFSYGGSSVITNFMAMGIVCGIKMRPKPERFRNLYS